MAVKEDLLKNLKTKDGVCLMYVGGAWVPASDGGVRELVNPSSGEVIARVAEGTKQDAQRAIAAALSATRIVSDQWWVPR